MRVAFVHTYNHERYISDLHLRDLEILLSTYLRNNEDVGHTRINIMGCISVAAWMRDIIKLKTPNLNELDAREGMAYLLNQLDSIEIDEEKLERWSYEREKEEKEAYDKRTDAFTGLGWPSLQEESTPP